MIMSIVNHTSGQLADEEVLCAIRAVNRQITMGFDPYWNLAAMLRLARRKIDGDLRAAKRKRAKFRTKSLDDIHVNPKCGISICLNPTGALGHEHGKRQSFF